MVSREWAGLRSDESDMAEANTAYWALLRPLDGDMELKEARLYIGTAQAGQYFRTAFYKLGVVDDKRTLIKVPESQVDFPTDATGTLTKDAAGSLYAGQDYFLGFMATHATPQYASVYLTEEAQPLLRRQGAAGLPDLQLISELSSSSTADAVPLVTYYSPIAAEIF